MGKRTISIEDMQLDIIIGAGKVTVVKERPATKDERTGPSQLMIHTVVIDLTGKKPEVSVESLVCEKD